MCVCVCVCLYNEQMNVIISLILHKGKREVAHLPLLPGPLGPIPITIPSMDQIDLFENISIY